MHEYVTFKCRNCAKVTRYAVSQRYGHRLVYFLSRHNTDLCYSHQIPAEVIVPYFYKLRMVKEVDKLELNLAIRAFNMLFGGEEIYQGGVVVGDFGGRTMHCTKDKDDDIVLFMDGWIFYRKAIRYGGNTWGHKGYVLGDYKAFQKEMLMVRMFVA